MPVQFSLFPDKPQEILIVDLETTGFLKQKGVIVEIGIACLNLTNGSVTPVFESLIREASFNEAHQFEPFGWIFKNSSLRFEDVEQAPTLDSLFDQIQDIFSRYPAGLTAYNAAFDLPFLRSRSFTFKALPCPMIAATPVVNLPPVSGRSSPKWPSVQESWDFFFPNKPYIEQHRALDDAMHEAEIVYELHKRDKFPVNS